jgi:hypothetical protein
MRAPDASPSPFALSLSKGCPSLLPRSRTGLRQAQPDRFWVGLGSVFALVACQSGAPANNQTAEVPTNAAAPSDPLATAERLVRAQIGSRGEVRFVEARVRDHQGVPVVCGVYEQGGQRQRYIVVNGEQVWVEPDMGPGQMPIAVNEFCAEGGRA